MLTTLLRKVKAFRMRNEKKKEEKSFVVWVEMNEQGEERFVCVKIKWKTLSLEAIY